MTKEDLKKEIINIVTNSNGAIKATALITSLSQEVFKSFTSNYIIDCLNDLVKNNEIVELEYLLPNMSYRLKSIYFPKGTKFLTYSEKDNYIKVSDSHYSHE